MSVYGCTIFARERERAFRVKVSKKRKQFWYTEMIKIINKI